jgi:hypothetical protein
MQATKVCSDCGKQKPIEKYSVAGTSPFPYCKQCNSERAKRAYHSMTPEERTEANRRRRGISADPSVRRERYASDPEYKHRVIEQAKRAYEKLRGKLVEAYGGKCACCGESELSFLEIDHVNGGGLKHFRSKPPANVYREIIKAAPSPDYQLLCANCNRGKWRNGGICPHKK